MYSFSSFWALFGRGGGGVKPNFADKNFMDTQTFLTYGHGHLKIPFRVGSACADCSGFLVPRAAGASFIQVPQVAPPSQNLLHSPIWAHKLKSNPMVWGG